MPLSISVLIESTDGWQYIEQINLTYSQISQNCLKKCPVKHLQLKVM